jgi:hypothetical protein
MGQTRTRLLSKFKENPMPIPDQYEIKKKNPIPVLGGYVCSKVRYPQITGVIPHNLIFFASY